MWGKVLPVDVVEVEMEGIIKWVICHVRMILGLIVEVLGV